MDESVWVGPAERTPPGWIGCESVEAFLASAIHPGRIVIDDRAAMLREADFIRLFEHSPLASIERVVGPWRAGIGRTDPVWPLVTTTSRESLAGTPWRPLTGGYDELAAVETLVDLTGITVAVQISDPELRAMWIDWLGAVGAELRIDAEDADVLIQDDCVLPLNSIQRCARWIVHLRPDPWNSAETSQPADVIAAESSESLPVIISVSNLDAPTLVMHRIASEFQRGRS